MTYKIAVNPCPSLWASDFSQFGDKKAGTSGSHDVGRCELDLSALIEINQIITKTSRKQKGKTKIGD